MTSKLRFHELTPRQAALFKPDIPQDAAVRNILAIHNFRTWRGGSKWEKTRARKRMFQVLGAYYSRRWFGTTRLLWHYWRQRWHVRGLWEGARKSYTDLIALQIRLERKAQEAE